jgi:hypothetical protein
VFLSTIIQVDRTTPLDPLGATQLARGRRSATTGRARRGSGPGAPRRDGARSESWPAGPARATVPQAITSTGPSSMFPTLALTASSPPGDNPQPARRPRPSGPS